MITYKFPLDFKGIYPFYFFLDASKFTDFKIFRKKLKIYYKRFQLDKCKKNKKLYNHVDTFIRCQKNLSFYFFPNSRYYKYLKLSARKIVRIFNQKTVRNMKNIATTTTFTRCQRSSCFYFFPNSRYWKYFKRHGH